MAIKCLRQACGSRSATGWAAAKEVAVAVGDGGDESLSALRLPAVRAGVTASRRHVGRSLLAVPSRKWPRGCGALKVALRRDYARPIDVFLHHHRGRRRGFPEASARLCGVWEGASRDERKEAATYLGGAFWVGASSSVVR